MLPRFFLLGCASAGIALALLLLPVGVVAQDNVTIDGSVKVGRGGAPNMRLEVVLLTAIGIEVVRGFTDEEGRFSFHGVGPGEYRILAKAPRDGRYKDGSADLHVDSRPGSRAVPVIVMLDAADAASGAAPKGGTVSVDEVQASIPREAKKLYESGTRAAAAGHADEAVALFRRALEIAPNYLFALNDLGSQLYKLDRLDESVAVLQKAAAIAPKAYSPRMNLGLALLASGRPADARAEIAVALVARPDDASALYVSGQIERALGNREQAIEAFKTALLNSSGLLVSALIQLGTLYEETGDRDAAVQAYRTYLDAAPKGPSAAFARGRLAALGVSQPPAS